MTGINPYLNFKGNTEEAFNFYKSIFGGEFTVVMRFKDLPPEAAVPGSDPEKIMHIALPIGKETILMGNDVAETTIGNNFFISINMHSEGEADLIFKGLSAGGKVTMPMQKVFWGAYFGMFKDKFDIQWMVSFDYNQK
ncbi:MAG: VOC family protein [bacterium]